MNDHSAADMAAGGCSRTATECVIPLHPRATCLTDFRNHAVRLMERRGYALCQCRCVTTAARRSVRRCAVWGAGHVCRKWH